MEPVHGWGGGNVDGEGVDPIGCANELRLGCAIGLKDRAIEVEEDAEEESTRAAGLKDRAIEVKEAAPLPPALGLSAKRSTTSAVQILVAIAWHNSLGHASEPFVTKAPDLKPII